MAVRQDYRNSHGRAPSIFFPRLYSEKIQWRKLFDSDPRHAVFCDKLTTRAYVAAKGFGHLLPELIWSGDDLSDSPIRSLDFPVVLKSNHASAQYVLVRDCAAMDYNDIANLTRKWLAVDWAEQLNEPAYLGIPRCLMIERMLVNPNGLPPIEHRAFIFHGKVKFIATILAFHDKCLSSFHTPEWERLDWKAINEPLEFNLEKPDHFGEVIRICECLGKGYDHLRVDFYHDASRLYIGEITVYTWSGLQPLTPRNADRDIGEYWNLDRPLFTAGAKILASKWGDSFRR